MEVELNKDDRIAPTKKIVEFLNSDGNLLESLTKRPTKSVIRMRSTILFQIMDDF